MPHINRIRLVNVNYNDAKSIYDDFNMRLDGKSTTYDLINTGGKSMLILIGSYNNLISFCWYPYRALALLYKEKRKKTINKCGRMA